MNNVKQKKKSSHRMLDLIIGLLSVLIVGAGVFAISMINESTSYSYEADSFYWRLEDEDYGRLVEMYYANEAADVKDDEELNQYYGVAKYFEAASYYKVYQESEDSVQMKKYLDRMENAKKQMGELEFLSETICEKLEIEL